MLPQRVDGRVLAFAVVLTALGAVLGAFYGVIIEIHRAYGYRP